MTVAVITTDVQTQASPWLKRKPEDFRIEFYSGSGAGGQNRNKVQASARITHLPTGTVRTAQTRSRENSQRLAMTAMLAELDRRNDLACDNAVNDCRKSQVGSGMRGDKRRTLRWQDDQTNDHLTGRRARTSDIMAGRFDLLWT